MKTTKKIIKPEPPTRGVRVFRNDAEWINDQAWKHRLTSAAFVRLLRAAYKPK